jgi:hypothetical protein
VNPTFPIRYRLRDGSLARCDLACASTTPIRGGTRMFGFHLHVAGSLEQAV